MAKSMANVCTHNNVHGSFSLTFSLSFSFLFVPPLSLSFLSFSLSLFRFCTTHIYHLLIILCCLVGEFICRSTMRPTRLWDIDMEHFLKVLSANFLYSFEKPTFSSSARLLTAKKKHLKPTDYKSSLASADFQATCFVFVFTKHEPIWRNLWRTFAPTTMSMALSLLLSLFLFLSFSFLLSLFPFSLSLFLSFDFAQLIFIIFSSYYVVW